MPSTWSEPNSLGIARTQVGVDRGGQTNCTHVGMNGQDGHKKEQQQLNGAGNAVGDVIFHPFENLAGNVNRINDDPETWFRQDNVGRRAGRVRGTLLPELRKHEGHKT